jgi:hypothetical protein
MSKGVSRLYICFVFFISLSSPLYSQDTNIVKYFPLKVGNTWTYNWRFSWVQGWIGGLAFDTLRVDSVSGNFYHYSYHACGNSPGDILFDSLKSRPGDSSRTGCAWGTVCYDTINVNEFGLLRPSKRLGYFVFEMGNDRRYVKNIGIDPLFSASGPTNCLHTLKGCVIDGVLYGDTSVISGIKPISNQIPSEFRLYQNYPNPFNPVTKIKFDVPSVETHCHASLQIYDMLGREVATLVNQELKPGTYEVEWDAANYPSGTYYYKLTSGDYTETKKMVLLK